MTQAGKPAGPAAALMLGACMLSGCTLGPDYVRPQAKDVSSYAAPGDRPLGGEQSLSPADAPDGQWWTQFQSPALNDLIARAATGNRDTAAIRARLAQAQEDVESAQAALLPHLSLGAQIGEQNFSTGLHTPLSVTLSPFTYYAVQPAASYPLDLFGGGRRTVERAAALAEYQRHTMAVAYLSLFAAVTGAALDNAGARAQIADLEEIVQGDQRNVALVQGALDAGSATRTELLSAQSQLAADRTLLPDLRQREAISRHALAVLVGRAAGNFTLPAFALDEFALPREIPGTLPSELIHQRPDILAAEAQLHAASAAIGIATANLYPQISLGATLTRQALTPDSLFSGTPNIWNLAATLTQPLFDGGALRAQRRAAIDAYQAALADYEKTVLTAFGQVADNLQALGNDAEKVSAESASEQISAQALDLVRRSYEAGNSGILEVVDAERRYAEARLGLSRAREQRLQHTVQLYMSLGGVKIPPAAEPLPEAGKECCGY